MSLGRKIRYAKICTMWNWLKWRFLTVMDPAQPHDSPRPPKYCPCPPALLPLPTRKRLLIGRVSGLVFFVLFCFFCTSVNENGIRFWHKVVFFMCCHDHCPSQICFCFLIRQLWFYIFIQVVPKGEKIVQQHQVVSSIFLLKDGLMKIIVAEEQAGRKSSKLSQLQSQEEVNALEFMSLSNSDKKGDSQQKVLQFFGAPAKPSRPMAICGHFFFFGSRFPCFRWLWLLRIGAAATKETWT